MRIFIDRDYELKCVESLILDAANHQRIAIVCANDGMGKTALLDEIYDRYRAHTAVALIDVSHTYDLFSFLNDVADQLEQQGVRLSFYRTMATRRTEPKQLMVGLSNIKANSSPTNINIAIQGSPFNRSSAGRRLPGNRWMYGLLGS